MLPKLKSLELYAVSQLYREYLGRREYLTQMGKQLLAHYLLSMMEERFGHPEPPRQPSARAVAFA